MLLGAVAASEWFPATLIFLFMLGLANTAFASTANTSLQLATPDHLRGRVMALYMLLFAGSTPIGGYLTGWMADRMGVQAAVGVEAGCASSASGSGCCTTRFTASALSVGQWSLLAQPAG